MSTHRYGVRTATLLVVASMIGTGVFTTTGLLLADVRSIPAVLLVWVVGGLVALAGALSYAELGVRTREWRSFETGEPSRSRRDRSV